MIKKKSIAIIILLLFSFCLIGCSSSQKASNTKSEKNVSTSFVSEQIKSELFDSLVSLIEEHYKKLDVNLKDAKYYSMDENGSLLSITIIKPESSYEEYIETLKKNLLQNNAEKIDDGTSLINGMNTDTVSYKTDIETKINEEETTKVSTYIKSYFLKENDSIIIINIKTNSSEILSNVSLEFENNL